MFKMRSFFLTSALAGAALAQGGPYAQCGGQGWTGSKTCVSGYTCTFSNEWYSQCLPGTGGGSPTTTLTTSTKTGTAPGPTSAPGKFKWFGINQSVAEFGEGKFPGVWGTDFYFPSDSTIQTLVGQGYNTFRVAFSMERMAPNKLTGGFDPAYLRNFTQTVNTITNAGAWAVIDPHNYGRYFGNIITNTQDFTAFWKTLATSFKSNSKVIFDTNNEYKEMDQTLVLNLNQAAIDAIRSVGATSQYIFAEGNAWSGAWSWNITNTNLVALKDPQNKLVYEMHQYLDSDSSGTHAECVSAEIGVQRLYGATKWLKDNGKVGIIGEYAGGPNSQCQAAVKNMLDHMKANSDVWLGALWWAGGPWWADYMYSFEPPSGTAYTYYNSLLKNYLP